MKAFTLKNGHILLLPDDTKFVQLPGTLDNLSTDAMAYVKRFRELADQIENYVKELK